MRKTVLLMDNAAQFLEAYSRLLEDAGYEVQKAATLEEAEEALREKCIHIAILDIRMRDEDSNDFSGLLLAQKQEYRAIPKIILTG